MVNIYHRDASFVEKFGAQDLHIAGQNKQINFVLSKNAQLQFFGILFAVRQYFNSVKRDLYRFAEAVKIPVVGNHTHNIPTHFTALESECEILQTMRNL